MGPGPPDNVLKDISNMAYQGIRKTNIFLENVAKVPMDESKRAGWIGEGYLSYVHFFISNYCVFMGRYTLQRKYLIPMKIFQNCVNECR